METKLAGANMRVRVRYLLERGRVFNSSGDSQQARPLFVRAWELARRTRFDGLAVDAAHMVAIVVPQDKSLAWNTRALDLAKTSSQSNARRWLGSLYNNIGWNYHDQQDYRRALGWFHKAVSERERTGKPEAILIAKWTVGRTLRSLNDTAQALQVQTEVLAGWTKLGKRDGYVYEELGECHLALHNAQEARKYFALAYDYFATNASFTNNHPKRLARMKQLAGQ